MIAKLVTHAGDRLSAIEAQARALDEFAIEGIRHNIPFLASLMQHPRWRSGALATGFIAEEYPDGFMPAAPITLSLIARHWLGQCVRYCPACRTRWSVSFRRWCMRPQRRMGQKR